MDKETEKEHGSEDFFERAENAPQETAGKGYTDEDFETGNSIDGSAPPADEDRVAGGDEHRMIDEPAGGSTRPAPEASQEDDA